MEGKQNSLAHAHLEYEREHDQQDRDAGGLHEPEVGVERLLHRLRGEHLPGKPDLKRRTNRRRLELLEV